MDRLTEQAAALALLDRGVGFRIPAPLLWRLFGRKTMKISVRRMRLGTLLYISAITDLNEYERISVIDDFRKSIVEEMGFTTIALSMSALQKNIHPVSKSIAACLLNSKWKIRLFAPMMARLLRNRCSYDQLQELTMWVMTYSRPESFLNTTKLLGAMAITKPMNCSGN